MIIRIVIGSIVLLAITTGCARQTGKVVPLPAAETVQRIVADNSGAWIVVRRSEIADTKKLITPTYCVIRRYRPDGSIERCDNLGVGLCRELRSDSRGVLALLVSDITSPSMTASLWVFDGRYWDSKGVLPCVAVGAYRMKSGAFLVWDETQLFQSEDGGRSWRALVLKMPEPGQAKFARESLLGELPDGVLAFAISVYEGGDRNTVRVGTYAETVGFTQKVSVDGLLASSVMAEDGDLLLLIHVSGQGPGEPSLKLYSTKAIADWPIRMLYERRSILPNQLLTLDARLLIIGASWIQPKSFLSPFPTHVIEVRAGTDGKWVGKRDTKLNRWKPRTIALAPNGTAWCTYSNVREHGLVLVE